VLRQTISLEHGDAKKKSSSATSVCASLIGELEQRIEHDAKQPAC